MKNYLKFNKDYFKVFTPQSAYWAGFIAADGSIKERGKSKALIIGLSNVDRNHLQKFKEDIEYSGTIKNYGYSYLSIHSKDICEDLYTNYKITKNQY